jgi:molybdenum cofactor biosynthesis enzyme MoaA
VIPLESQCNAKCPYCINQFRNLGTSILDVDTLEKCLDSFNQLEAIEITGGGEPTLHPQINKIIDLCTKKTRTQLYSNGKLIHQIPLKTLENLHPLCISRAHYDPAINERIMGVNYDEQIFSQGLDIKISSVLFSEGISYPEDVEKYITWAKGKARKIVFRPLFEDVNYSEKVREKIIPLETFIQYFDLKIIEGKNPKKNIEGIEVEFEIRSCSCENTNPILHANGKLNYTWNENDTDRIRN